MNYHGVKQSNKTLLMKVTSRERSAILLDTVKAYIDMAANTHDMVWLFSFDDDDKTLTIDFHNKLIDMIQPMGRGVDSLAVTASSTGKVDAINRDVNNFKCDWDILLNISDDQRPIVKGYDDIIRRSMPDDLDASLWFPDGQPRINTQEIQGRNYYNRFKYIYHPAFKSLFCDNLSTVVARYLGKLIKSNQQIIKHFHPAWGGNESFKRDALYDRNDKFWKEDEATYKRLLAEGIEKLII